MHYTHAIVRLPGKNFARGITTVREAKPDYETLLLQHAAYISTLQDLGLSVEVLKPLQEYPDAYFVEDTAVVTKEVAIIARPGAESRRGEELEVEPVLARHIPVAPIQAPGTVEGGDVLMVGKDVFVGISERTNQEGAHQLAEILAPYDYQVTTIPVSAGLHLKSSVNYAGENSLLVAQDYAGIPALNGYEKIIVDPRETYAANVLWINGSLLIPSGFPETRGKLEKLGLPLIELDVSEARKMDGGLTCMSIRF